mgnify:FL=1
MKKLIEDNEEGLERLLGERVTCFCVNYIYTGKLVGVNDATLLLNEASIVYETGAFTEKAWKDAQPLPHPVYLLLRNVESVMVLK